MYAKLLDIIIDGASKKVDDYRFGVEPEFGLEPKLVDCVKCGLSALVVNVSNYTDRNISNIVVTCGGNEIASRTALAKGSSFDIILAPIACRVDCMFYVACDLWFMPDYKNGDDLEICVEAGIMQYKFKLNIAEFLEREQHVHFLS